MQARLILLDPPALRREVRLSLPTTVGRGREAKVKLVHSQVSRVHCEFFEKDGVLHVRDLGSTNGTFVGDNRIVDSVVAPGEQVTIGAVKFKAVYEPSGSAVLSSGGVGPTETIRKTGEATFKFLDKSGSPEADIASPAEKTSHRSAEQAGLSDEWLKNRPTEMEPLDFEGNSFLPTESPEVSEVSIPFPDSTESSAATARRNNDQHFVGQDDSEELKLAPVEESRTEAIGLSEIPLDLERDDSLHILPPLSATEPAGAAEGEELRLRIAGSANQSASREAASDMAAEDGTSRQAAISSPIKQSTSDDDDFEKFVESL